VCVCVIAHFVVGSAIQGRDTTEQWSLCSSWLVPDFEEFSNNVVVFHLVPHVEEFSNNCKLVVLIWSPHFEEISNNCSFFIWAPFFNKFSPGVSQ
jgi:hypothetical protein